MFIITDLAGLENIDDVYFRELSMRHDIMIINVSDGTCICNERFSSRQ